MALNMAQIRDTKWLTLEVCREFQRGTCSRSDQECKFAHPAKSCQVDNGRVIACFDSLKVRKGRWWTERLEVKPYAPVQQALRKYMSTVYLMLEHTICPWHVLSLWSHLFLVRWLQHVTKGTERERDREGGGRSCSFLDSGSRSQAFVTLWNFLEQSVFWVVFTALIVSRMRLWVAFPTNYAET